MTRVLVVDDVAAVAEGYAYDLQRIGGYDTLTAGDGAEALQMLDEEAIDCVILDLEMPGVDGFEVLETMKGKGLAVPVIVYTGTGNFDRCVRAVRLGAYAFIDKAEPVERVIREIENALEHGRLSAEVRALRRRLDAESPLVGGSPAMERLRDAIARVAPIPSPALILGESGTGKELVARELHRLGPGPGAPFVAVNSGALPEALVESELFGHERGAFTGADRLRKGAFEAAGDGTLFLDEIGDLPAPAQAKLLRAIEQREVSRLGGTRAVPVSARVVAATHRDLEADVGAGRFRQDLYYRLNVHILQVPPLRDRRSDIPELVEHFLTTICDRFGIRRKRLSEAALEALMGCGWRRNNVRELRNVVERMIIASDGEEIGPGAVPADVGDERGEGIPFAVGRRTGTFRELKAEAERQIVIAALERNGWHVTKAAEALGLADHSSLLKIMRRHGISRR